jgi:hypothetical protein
VLLVAVKIKIEEVLISLAHLQMLARERLDLKKLLREVNPRLKVKPLKVKLLSNQEQLK